MTDHDPLCPHDTHPFPATCETCILIAKVRDNQRGFDIRQQVAERDAFRAKVEALRAEDPHNQPVRDAYDAVLALLDGGNDDT